MAINISFIFQLRSLLCSNNSKKSGYYGKYTLEQKAMIGKRAAEHDVTNLCIPERFILVVTLYHTFLETRAHFFTRAPGVWFRPDPTTILLPQITTNPSIHEKLPLPPPPPPPPKKKKEYPLYGICDRLWEKGPLSAQNDFSVQAFLVYVPETKNSDVNFFGPIGISKSLPTLTPNLKDWKPF